MSYQAPFVDAARSVDPVNRENTFISYYTYGSVLGLALDLSLRNMEGDLSLDGFMQQMWEKYGKPEHPYTVRDIQNTLTKYAGENFSNTFFLQHIYDSQMPDYGSLLASVGVSFEQAQAKQAYFGAYVQMQDGKGMIVSNPQQESPAYEARLSNGDILLSIGDTELSTVEDFNTLISGFKPGSTMDVVFERYGQRKEAKLTFQANPAYVSNLLEQQGKEPDKSSLQRRENWLRMK